MTRENDTAAACYPDMATHQNVCVEREKKERMKDKIQGMWTKNEHTEKRTNGRVRQNS